MSGLTAARRRFVEAMALACGVSEHECAYVSMDGAHFTLRLENTDGDAVWVELSCSDVDEAIAHLGEGE